MGVATVLVQFAREILQPWTQLHAQVFAVDRELHDRLDVVEAVTRVVPATAEDDPVDATRYRRVGSERLERIRQLDLAALAWFSVLQDVEDLGLQHVATDDGIVRRRVLGA